MSDLITARALSRRERVALALQTFAWSMLENAAGPQRERPSRRLARALREARATWRASRAGTFKTHRTWDSRRARIARVTLVGDCLIPEFPDGTLCYFDATAPWGDGDLVLLLDPRDRHRSVKRMRQVEGGETVSGRKVDRGWVMTCSNMPPVMLTEQQIIGPLVASLHGIGLRGTQCEISERVKGENAKFRELAQQEFARRGGSQ